jgi:protein SCO1
MVGAPDRPSFALTDHMGRAVTERDHAGMLRLIYFGFTACRVVCPRALEKLDGVLKALGPAAAANIQALYVTVDPDRDTPAVMKAFLEGRNSRFLGLTGTTEAIEQAKSGFRVFAQRKFDPDGYQVAHTAIAYLLDRDGRYIDHFPDAMAAEKIIERLRL